MAIIIGKKSAFELAPAGTHYFTCVGVYEIGTHGTDFGPKQKLILGFELTDTPMADGRPFVVNSTFNISMGKNKSGEVGKLRGLLEGWRGKGFTDTELEGFDIAKLCGVPGLLNIVHNQSGENTYANVKSASPLVKGMAKIKPINPLIVYSIAENGDDFPKGMSDWIVTKVKESMEWAARGSTDDVDDEPQDVAAEDAGDSEDIPF